VNVAPGDVRQTADLGRVTKPTRQLGGFVSLRSLEQRGRMADVVILGSGGMGREAAAWADDAGFTVLGFLSADASTVGTEVAGLPVLGGDDWLTEHDPEVEVVVALGAPAVRAAACARIAAVGFRLTTIVHPSAYVGPRCVIGVGSIICPGVVLTTDVALGESVIVNFGAAIGHDVRIDDHAFIAPNAALAGNVTVGARADIGIGASIRQGLTIGADAVVGGGAMVVRDVPAGMTVVGVPAMPMER
jgi:sugar O-acyltransferase (sialic acid O-acetyltransferase NeuD family)